MPPGRRAASVQCEREDERSRHGRGACEARSQPQAPARAAAGDQRRVELGGQARVQARRHRRRQRLCSELGQPALHGRELLAADLALEAVVVHVR
jgi:hypothetical protein